MSSFNVAGFTLCQQVIGEPVDPSVLAKPGLIVVQDINTQKCAVSDTPDLLASLGQMSQGLSFNKVFENLYHKKVAENVRVYYRQLRTLGQASEFELTRSHCRIALMGDLAPPGQDEATFSKMKQLSERNHKYYEYLCFKIPSLAERMEKFNART